MTRVALVLIALAVAGCVTPAVPQVGVGGCKDGRRHGPYTIEVVDGPVVVTGSFADGKKDGLFTFYSTGGTKMAEIPYSGDAKTGTIRLWYSEFAYPEAAGRVKLEAEYMNDIANGYKRTWWPSGSKRAEELYREGLRIQTEAWEDAGVSLPRSQAEQLSRDSAEADSKYYRILESEIAAYPPVCARPEQPGASVTR